MSLIYYSQKYREGHLGMCAVQLFSWLSTQTAHLTALFLPINTNTKNCSPSLKGVQLFSFWKECHLEKKLILPQYILGWLELFPHLGKKLNFN